MKKITSVHLKINVGTFEKMLEKCCMLGAVLYALVTWI